MTSTPVTTRRVLVVDDDGATTRTFARMLSLEGYEVRTAGDAEQGLRESDSWDPDAIILDLRMPFINGLGFLYRLRAGEKHRDTPAVIVTADLLIDNSVISEIRELGASVHFKPLWIDELVVLVQTLVPSELQRERLVGTHPGHTAASLPQ